MATMQIHPQLAALAVPIDSLRLDPQNARRHPEANLAALQASLRVYGQRKPIVFRRSDAVIIAGNGTWQAARAAGWTEIAAVGVDDDLQTATGYALADNRTAELAEWDPARLEQLLAELELPDLPLQQMLDELTAELPALFAAEATESESEPSDLTQDTGTDARRSRSRSEVDEGTFLVLLTCASEAEQRDLLTEFASRGLSCRALIT